MASEKVDWFKGDDSRLFRMLNCNRSQFHAIKRIIIQQNRPLLLSQCQGTMNPDIGVDRKGTLWLRHPFQDHKSAKTDVTLASYAND